MSVLSSIWEFVKKHWQAILLVLVITVGYAWIRNQQSHWAETVRKLNESHQIEIDKINQARLQEEKEHAQELKVLQESLAKIEQDYQAAQKALDERTKQHQTEIVKKYGNDMKGLAELAADRFGFVVVSQPTP